MSSTSNYIGLLPDLPMIAAKSGVSLARLQAAAVSGTLSQPELRDVIAVVAAMGSVTIATATKNAAVTENANIKHPSCRKVYDTKDVGDIL